MSLIFLEKLAGFPDRLLGALFGRGTEVLTITRDGCCSLAGDSCLCLERCFLASVQIAQPSASTAFYLPPQAIGPSQCKSLI